VSLPFICAACGRSFLPVEREESATCVMGCSVDSTSWAAHGGPVQRRFAATAIQSFVNDRPHLLAARRALPRGPRAADLRRFDSSRRAATVDERMLTPPIEISAEGFRRTEA
jgi:hypothetical protein